jgi:uncharacterized protein (TIGR03067 family)
MKLAAEVREGSRIITGGKAAELKLAPAVKIQELDISPADGCNKGTAFLAICELEGDKLKINAYTPGAPQPKEFATKAGSESLLFTLVRDKR